jgi:predicted transcriptional regulator
MLKQRDVTLSVPEDLYQRVERVASTMQRNVIDVMVETIAAAFTPYPEDPQRAAMEAEISAYEAMHTELLKAYLGQYVAIYQGKLVDFDGDPVALHQRIALTYPGKTVLSRKVQKDAAPVIHIRSPRLERQS